MLKAVIFDFNGIILNDEPLHFSSMKDAVAELGLRITKEEYWSRYLPFDDTSCLQAICRDRGVVLTADQQERTLERKIFLYQQLIQEHYPIFPGVAAFIRAISHRLPLALASGARRDEIETTLRATGLIEHFRVIVGAEDFTLGKPNPESYLLALELLNDNLNHGHSPIQPCECLVIEDSVGGVQGARAAGMICLAVSNTYPPENLQAAHRVVSSLEDVTIESLESLMQGES
jgi:beta-phosphoglucomutase